MHKTLYVAALLAGVSGTAQRARADGDSCISAQAEGRRSRQQELRASARAAFARCAQAQCPSSIRQDCANAYAELEASAPVVPVTDASGEQHSDADVEAESPATPALPDDSRADADERSARPLAPGPNMAVVLMLQSKRERLAEHSRRLTLATYGLTLTGLAVGSWAILSGVRGRTIERACASEESCTPATAGHGRMLYRGADAGAAIGAACGISAAILLWRLLTLPSPDEQRSASLRDVDTSAGASRWQLVF